MKRLLNAIKCKEKLSIPYRQIAEAVYRGLKFETIIQRELNHRLIWFDKKYLVGEWDESNGSFDKKNKQLISTEEKIKLKKILSDLNIEFKAQKEKKALFDKLKKEIKKHTFKFITGDDLENALIQYCDIFFHRLLGSSGISILKKKYNDISFSVGFHWIEPQNEKQFLRYYTVCGWKLHPFVKRALTYLHKKYRKDLSKSEFILRLILILSYKHFCDIPKKKTNGQNNIIKAVNNGTNIKVLINGLSSKDDFSDFINKFLDKEEEKNKWQICLKNLQSFQKINYEGILKFLMISGFWKQRTTLGPYPLFLREGEELYTDDFQIQPPLDTQQGDIQDFWNWSVITRIENFFLSTEWLNILSVKSTNNTKYKTYLVAKPIFLQGFLLGDFFIVGIYPSKQNAIVRTRLLRENVSDLIYLFLPETEYLVRFITTMKLIHHVVQKKSIKEFGLPTKNEIWNRTRGVFTPIQNIVEERILPHARIAAVAAVMSRNMSHNIGSHVLAALAQKSNLNADEIKILLNYLKHRQEFIADISTASACIVFNRNLYEDILSRLIPIKEDERWEVNTQNYYRFLINNGRHSECYPLLLLDNISGKSDIKANDIKIKTIKYNGKELKVNIKYNSGNGKRIIENDIPILLPNDILGSHALFIIFENIIRNSSKHTKIKDGNNGSLEFIITIQDTNDDYYKITVIDNLGEKNKSARSNNGFLQNLRKHITDSILNENKLRDGGWGFLEMKICAAYLVRYPLEEIDRFDGKNKSVSINNRVFPDLLDIGFYDDDGNPSINGEPFNLGFSFHLLKPKIAQVVNLTNTDGLVSELNKDEYKKIGVHTGKPHDFQSAGTEHEFLVLLGDSLDVSKVELETNQRCIKLDKIDGWNCDTDELRKLLYEKYLNNQVIKEPLFANASGIIENGDNNNLKNAILFDNHGGWGKIHPDKISELLYYEPYGSQSLTRSLFVETYQASSTPQIKKDIMKYEINEAARCEIILLDERIQSAASSISALKIMHNSNEKEIKHIVVLNHTKVYVPKLDEANLGENDIDVQNTIGFINNKLNENNIEYLVIHLGILEKLSGSTDIKDIEKWIREHKDKDGKQWLNNRNAKTNFKIVVISGRGLPSNLPDGILYCPASLVYQYTISYPSKILLTKLLKSIRKYRKA